MKEPYFTDQTVDDVAEKMISNLIDCKNEEITIGMPVIVVFEGITPEITLPRFKKISV